MAPDRFSIALAQLNPVLGDFSGNVLRARKARETATQAGADLVLFSELFITGYPPEDLVLKPAFHAAAMDAVERLATDTGDGGPAMLVGTPWPKDGALFNAVALLDNGVVQAITLKSNLPNYGVFDEKRVFAPGPLPGPLNIRGIRVGVPVCEDIWAADVAECLCETGAEMLLVPNGSPFDARKRDHRLNVTIARVVETGLPLVYLNQVGGQDELVFDGASFVINANRRLALQLPDWEEAVVVTSWRRGATRLGVRAWRSGRNSGSEPGAVLRDGAGPEGLREQEWFSRRGDRVIRRRGFGAHGRCRGGRAWA